MQDGVSEPNQGRFSSPGLLHQPLDCCWTGKRTDRVANLPLTFLGVKVVRPQVASECLQLVYTVRNLPKMGSHLSLSCFLNPRIPPGDEISITAALYDVLRPTGLIFGYMLELHDWTPERPATL